MPLSPNTSPQGTSLQDTVPAPDTSPRDPASGELSVQQLAPWGGLLIVLGLWAFGFSALDQYGVNWDEALGDFFFGERYLSYVTSLDPAYLDFEGNPYGEDHRPDLSSAPFKSRPWEYYPVANTLAAASSVVFARWLGWLDPFDGYHALNLLLAGLLILCLYPFLQRRYGMVTATAASVLLLTSPRVFSHLMANIKDFPSMVAFSLTLLAFIVAFEKGSSRGLLGAGMLWGLALGTKANALFVAPIVVLVVLLGGIPDSWRGRRQRLLLALVGAGGLALAVLFAAWPYLWADPLGHLQQHLDFLLHRKATTDPRSVAPVFQALLYTTPPAFLALFAIGLWPTLVRARLRDRTALLLLLWPTVVLGRYLLPQAVNYDGVRHLLEIFPPMAAIAGIGLATAARRLVAARTAAPETDAPKTGAPKTSLRWRAVLVTVALLPGSWALLASHPFQLAYWNSLVGGLGGAQAKDLPQACDYWGLSYRLGLRWMNEEAPEGALLAVPVVEHTVRLMAPEQLRRDIALLPITTPFSPVIPAERLRLTRQAALEKPVYVMFVERRDWLNRLMVDCLQYLQPEMRWQLDGGNVLAIYRYPPQLAAAALEAEGSQP